MLRSLGSRPMNSAMPRTASTMVTTNMMLRMPMKSMFGLANRRSMLSLCSQPLLSQKSNMTRVM